MKSILLFRFCCFRVLVCCFAWWCLSWITALPVAAQVAREVQHHQHGWLGLFGQVRLNDKISLWTDVHYRRADFLERPTAFIFRPGLVYHLPHHLSLTVGYAYVRHYPAPGLTTVRPEHRPWQQINWVYRGRRIQTQQWLRFEQRFNRRVQHDALQDDYAFNYKFRAQMSVFVPLNSDFIEPGTVFASVINELHVNAGKQIVYNQFDQNRFFTGLGYQFTKRFSSQLGYMNQYVQSAAGNRFHSNHTARLFFFYNLDLRQPNG